MGLKIRKYPHPYKAWLTMANDPDNTTISAWDELHRFIWEELGLPFGDSLFVHSYNQNLPEQVNLFNHPHIASAHYHDIIHTWGDYMHARKRGFDREDAYDAVKLLDQANVKPSVWIDHASFAGNMMHGTNKGAVNELKDSSGVTYQNFVYTLDIAKELGIRYVWNGEVTKVAGQDRKTDFSDECLLSEGNLVKGLLRYINGRVRIPGLQQRITDNRQYYPRKFPDGSQLYCFRRYGTWADADIDGLANVISTDKIDKLIRLGGTAVVYSHLGKRHSSGTQRESHIPVKTRDCLKHLAERFHHREIMISPTSKLLDYLVLRDHIVLQGSQVDFNADGIRFSELSPTELTGMTFSFSGQPDSVRVNGISVDVPIEAVGNGVYSITFP